MGGETCPTCRLAVREEHPFDAFGALTPCHDEFHRQVGIVSCQHPGCGAQGLTRKRSWWCATHHPEHPRGPVTHPTDRAEAMREACAKACENHGVTSDQVADLWWDGYRDGREDAARAIRALPLPAAPATTSDLDTVSDGGTPYRSQHDPVAPPANATACHGACGGDRDTPCSTGCEERDEPDHSTAVEEARRAFYEAARARYEYRRRQPHDFRTQVDVTADAAFDAMVAAEADAKGGA